MPYASGQIPVVGDYVKNKWEQPGTVIRVHEAQDGHEDISVRWDDGGTDHKHQPRTLSNFQAGLAGRFGFLFALGIYFFLSHFKNTPKSARSTVNPDTHRVSVRCWGNMCITYLMTRFSQNCQGHTKHTV